MLVPASARIWCVYFSDLSVAIVEWLRRCDASRHTTVFTNTHTPCSAIDANSFVIIKGSWMLDGWMAFCDVDVVRPSVEWTTSTTNDDDGDDNIIVSPHFSLFIPPAAVLAQANRWRYLFECISFAWKIVIVTEFLFLSLPLSFPSLAVPLPLSCSMMMSSSYCIYRTMLTLSTEPCSKFEQTNLLRHRQRE